MRFAGLGLAAFFAAIVSLAAAAPAPAASIEYRSAEKRIHYTAGAGEVNRLVVDQNTTTGLFSFTDSGTSGTGGGIVISDADGLGGPCTVVALTPNVATCPMANVDAITISVGDGDDTVLTTAARPTVLDGGAGYDLLTGGPGDDQLLGGSGADRIDGRDGNDFIDTGFGGYRPESFPCPDLLPEEPQCRDEVQYLGGIDTLSYESRPFPVYVDTRAARGPASLAADDPDPTCMQMLEQDLRLSDHCEADYTTNNQKVDNIIGSPFDDILIGNKYNNTIVGGDGADIMCGELGNDTVDYSAVSEDVSTVLDGNPAMPTDPNLIGDTNVLGRARKDCRSITETGFVLTPSPTAPVDCIANDGRAGEGDCIGEDIENVTGGSGDDHLVGGNPDALINEAPPIEPRGANVLRGGPGDDLLDGKYGPDTLIGGSGSDTVTYVDRPASEPVSATIDGKGNDGSSNTASGGITGDLNPFNGRADEIMADVENLIGGAGPDTLGGDAGPNQLTGGGGGGDIEGKGGNDLLSGGNGDDSLRGGEGNDTLSGDSGNDVLAGDAAGDNLVGGAGNDLMHGGTGPDSLVGNDGIDTVDWAYSTSSVSVTVNGVNDDGTENERDNVASDVEGANGGLADDTLVLGAGDGFIAGGPGNDYLDGGLGSDSIEGNDGLDEVDYSSRVGAVSVDANSPGGDGEAGENDDVFGNVETIRGGSANDMLVGSGTASVLIGNAGDDQLFGMAGDDQLFGGPGADGLEGGWHNDTLDGGDDADNLFGSSGGDTLLGGGADDRLDGGVGPDAISGGAGTDTASYADRTKALDLSFDGNSNDGESGEQDVIKMDVENTAAGAGADLVNSLNEVKNTVSCGRGTDRIAADTFDDISGDCERIINTSPCKASPSPATMSASGVVTVRVSCTQDASGSLQLRTAGKVKTSKNAKRAKRLTLGSKSFKLKRGQSTKLKVRIKGAGKRVIKRSKKGVTARSTVTVRQRFGVRALSLKKGATLKIKVKR